MDSALYVYSHRSKTHHMKKLTKARRPNTRMVRRTSATGRPCTLLDAFWIFVTLACCTYMGHICHLRWVAKDVDVPFPVRSDLNYMLTCVNASMPQHRTRWQQLQTCVDTASVKHLNPSHNPDAVLFVFRYTPFSTIYVSDEYFKMDPRHQALGLIHECAHLAFRAEDHAYRWEESFTSLPENIHLENADSFVHWIDMACPYRRRRLRDAQFGTAAFSNNGDIGRLRGRPSSLRRPRRAFG